MAGGQAGGANSSQRVFVVYEPNASSVRVGVASGANNLTSLMNQTMLTVAGHNLPDPVAVGVASVGECVERCASLAGDPSHCTWGVERRAEISGLGALAGCFLALGFGLRLVGTASARR
eukprot:COSAG04_NODE_30_length_35898_cov_42.288053_18_plen_119_part_00